MHVELETGLVEKVRKEETKRLSLWNASASQLFMTITPDEAQFLFQTRSPKPISFTCEWEMNDASCDGNSVTLINLRVSEERLLDTGNRGAPCSAFWKSVVFVSKLHARFENITCADCEWLRQFSNEI